MHDKFPGAGSLVGCVCVGGGVVCVCVDGFKKNQNLTLEICVNFARGGNLGRGGVCVCV